MKLARRILIALYDAQHTEHNTAQSITLRKQYDALCDNYTKYTQTQLEELAPLAMQLTQTTNRKYMPSTSKEILQLFAKIKCNAMTIYDEISLEQIGVGIYPLAATMNHDCKPNTILAFSNQQVTIRSNQNLSPNAEVDHFIPANSI